MIYTDDEIKWVFDRTDGRCFYCGTNLVLGCHGMVAERGAWDINYFLPTLDKGEHRRDNWVPACIACDTVKERFPLGIGLSEDSERETKRIRITI